jgi:hypothetical protein
MRRRRRKKKNWRRRRDGRSKKIRSREALEVEKGGDRE